MASAKQTEPKKRPAKFLTPSDVAVKEGVTPKRIRQLLQSGRITGAEQDMGRWKIPTGYKVTERPFGPRRSNAKGKTRKLDD